MSDEKEDSIVLPTQELERDSVHEPAFQIVSEGSQKQKPKLLYGLGYMFFILLGVFICI